MDWKNPIKHHLKHKLITKQHPLEIGKLKNFEFF